MVGDALGFPYEDPGCASARGAAGAIGVLPFLDVFGRPTAIMPVMTKNEHRQLVASFVALDDAITRASSALSNGDVTVAEDALERAKLAVYTDAPALTVPEVADELGVSRPTARSWIDKGLLDVVADTSPRRVTFSSIQGLKERLAKLRVIAKDERRYSQLLSEAADRRALARTGAREGLEDALAGDTVDL
jgi:excisionase family DNA binding protein